MAFNKEHAIIAQNSATAAATIVASLVGPGDAAAEVIATFEQVRTAIFNGTLGHAGAEAVVVGIESAPSHPSQQAAPAAPAAPAGDGNRQDPGNIVVKTGKHQGKTIAAIYDEDPDWVEWAAENIRNTFLKRVTGEFLAGVA